MGFIAPKPAGIGPELSFRGCRSQRQRIEPARSSCSEKLTGRRPIAEVNTQRFAQEVPAGPSLGTGAKGAVLVFVEGYR